MAVRLAIWPLMAGALCCTRHCCIHNFPVASSQNGRIGSLNPPKVSLCTPSWPQTNRLMCFCFWNAGIKGTDFYIQQVQFFKDPWARLKLQNTPLSPLEVLHQQFLTCGSLSPLGTEQPLLRSHTSDTHIKVHNSSKNYL